MILFWLPASAPQQINQQPQEAGEIREIKCKGYLKRPNAEPRELNRKSDKGLKLYPLDEVKCEGAGTLELVLHGQPFSVKAEYGWYPLPVPNNAPPPDQWGKSRVGQLKGTFRLDRGPSDIGEPGYNLPADWTTPLRPPSILAIELSGTSITMTSSLFPKFSFVADGREHEVQTSQGETVKVVAEVKENELTIRAKTAANAMLEAIFSLQPDGKLKVSQSLSETGLPTIFKEASYLRLSDMALLDIFSTESPGRTTPSEGVLLRKGERILAEVDSDISSILAKEGDEFSLTVKEPARFRGAKVKGHLSNINRTSDGDELHLNFDVILLNNRTGYLLPGRMEVKAGAEPSRTADNAPSRAGAVLGIVSSKEKRREPGATAVAGTYPYVKIEKGREIIMTPVSGGPP
jgi:hypothetical protein